MLPSLRPSYCLTLLPDGVTLTPQRRAWPFASRQNGAPQAAESASPATPIGSHVLPDLPQAQSLGMESTAIPDVAMAGGISSHPSMPSASQPWHEALQAGLSQLKSLPAGSRLTVVLSNQWLRYKLLPAMPPLQPYATSLAVARTWFMETYGETAATWHIALEPLPQGEHQFACALNQSLLTAISAMVTQSGCQLVSVQPAIMHLHNRLYRRLLGRDLCGMVQVEAGRIHLALMRDAGWLGLAACVSHPQTWPQQLLALLQRETLLLGDAPLAGRLFVHLALPHAHAAWPTAQRALANMGWQAEPVFAQASPVNVVASPMQAWAET